MATTRSFQSMLNEWLNYDLLAEEILKRDYFLNKVEKDQGWKSGPLVIPFQGGYASSIKFGSLTAENDVSQDEYVRGTITTQPEVWGTMLFHHKDLMQHDGKIKETTFLRMLPDQINNFMQGMKNAVSQNIMTGNSVTNLTVNGTVLGVAVVDHIERLTLGQKLQIVSTAPLSANVYVIALDINTNKVTVSAARGGAVLDISLYLVADDAKLVLDDSVANGMTSIRDSLLSAINGGSATLYGVSKLAYPYLQSINLDGAAITASNILEKLFDGFNTVRNKGKGNPSTAIVSWKWMANIMKQVETTKGAFKVNPSDTKASIYGWTEILITGVKGQLTIVSVQEASDDVIMFIDWAALKFHSNGFFTKRTSPDGLQYYEVRQTTGFVYLIDIALMGDFVLNRPSTCGIYHSIP